MFRRSKKGYVLLAFAVLLINTLFGSLPVVSYANTTDDPIPPTEATGNPEEPMPNEEGLFESIDLFTYVYPEGEKVLGAAVKLYEEITDEGVDKDTFTVKAETFSWETFQLQWGTRTITDIYVHDRKEMTEAPKGTGKYIIIEFDSNDGNSGSYNYDLGTGLNSPVPYQFTLEKELVKVNGEKIDPDNNIYSPTGFITPIVDDFGKYEITNDGFTMSYRLFEPVTNEGESYPLVIFLHGAGERGNDNELQLRGNRGALTWADPEFQSKHPAYVVAPQVKPDGWWVNKTEVKTVIALIEKLTDTYPIDTNRIYITGVSMGGFGTWNLLGTRPDLFAAAIPICGGLSLPGNDYAAYAELVKSIPIWTTHSYDDSVVNINSTIQIINAIERAGEVVVRGEYAGNLSREGNNAEAQKMWDEAIANDSHILFTTYTEGTTPTNAHWSWVPTYENDVIKEWLFAQGKADKPGEDPKEDPIEEPKDDPKGDPKEEPKEDPIEEPKDEPQEGPKEETKEELGKTPGDDSGKAPGETEEKPGDKLPSTATTLPNILMGGAIIAFASGLGCIYLRKKQAIN